MSEFYLWQPEEGNGKEVPSGCKNEEEIAKFTVDERLNDVERAVLFLNGGQAIQQKHAITNLPSILRGRGRAAYDAVAQPLKSALNRLDQEAQIGVAEAFATIAREKLLSPADLHVCLLPVVVRNINKEKSEEETDAWLGALRDMIPHLDQEVLRSEVLSLALSKGEVQDSVNSRVICARILGDVTQHMSKDDIDRGFFKKAMAMCQDVDHQVRVSMAQQLAAIGRAVGREMASKYVLDELSELLNDEEQQVRAAAYVSLVSLLDTIAPETRKARVVPILRQHMRPMELDPLLQRCITQHFGAMLSAVKTDLEADDQQLFLGCFKHLAARNDIELRRLSALQLPLVLAAAAGAPGSGGGGAVYAAQFSDTLVNLVTDAEESVRIAAASNFHEVSRVVGQQSCALLTRPLVRLLRDSLQAVQATVLQELASTLVCWAPTEEHPRQEVLLGELLRALLDLEMSLQRAWRMQNQLALALPAVALIFTGDQLHEHFMPMAIRFLSSQVAAVRPAAGDGIAALLRTPWRERYRSEVFLRVVRDFARGRSFSLRLAFIHILAGLLHRYSGRWVKDYAFDLCLELLYDPVPNVRLQMVALLPALKQTIKMPEDVDLLERLNNAIANAMNDNDKDVSGSARTCNDTFKKVPLRVGGGVSLGATGGDGGVSVSVFNYETEDRRKEDEEAEFAFSPEDVKEIKSEIMQVAGKKNSARARADSKEVPEAPSPGARGAVAARRINGTENPARVVGGPTSRPHAPGGTPTPGSSASSSGPTRPSSQAGSNGSLAKTTSGNLLAASVAAKSSTASPASKAAGALKAAASPTSKAGDRMSPLIGKGPMSPGLGGASGGLMSPPLRLPSITTRAATIGAGVGHSSPVHNSPVKAGAGAAGVNKGPPGKTSPVVSATLLAKRGK